MLHLAWTMAALTPDDETAQGRKAQRTRVKFHMHAEPKQHRFLRAAPIGGLLCGALVACTPGIGEDGGPGADSAYADGGVGVFDDHTVGGFSRTTELSAFLIQGPGRSQSKFIVTRFGDQLRRSVRFLDSEFFAMHDEWYWFRLLNGHGVEGADDVVAIAGLRFATVGQIVAWAREQDELPLDLRFVGDDRLYSPHFYTLALQDPRAFGLGSLVHIPAKPGVGQPERWLFELEYGDSVDHAQLMIFFASLQATLPPEVAANIVWVARSAVQRQLVEQMRAEQLPFFDRVTTYDEIVVPGETEVYSPGITAGRLKIVRSGEPVGETSSTDVLVLGEVPDLLPQACALITAQPQTPLAHVNLLARNRGIPNGYLAGVLDDPQLDQLARARAPVIVYAVAPDRLDIVAISNSDYNAYRQLLTTDPVAVPPVDLASAPLSVELDATSIEQTAELKPLIGGKSAGFMALAEHLADVDASIAMPPDALALTIRPYAEHLGPIRWRIEAMLVAADFVRETAVRLLVLEGQHDYLARYPGRAGQDDIDAFLDDHPAGDVLGDLVREGGLRRVIRDLAIDPATLRDIQGQLEDRFGHYAVEQGLRFRSSATVEDIEGFNGAGLYTSNTGYLWPERLADPDLQQRSVAWALKKTWASYWSAEAFEERRLAAVDHLSGAMGVLVHARFDDDLELANGVFTLTLREGDAGVGAEMEINTQLGAQSVTNPVPGSGALPEVARVGQDHEKTLPWVRYLRSSTEVEPGTHLLGEGTLRSLFLRARQVAADWLQQSNRGLSASRRARTVVLDFEFRRMAEGWPALDSGAPRPARIIIKQARSLEPGITRVPEGLRDQPVPRDVLRRARRIDYRTCQGEVLTLRTLEVYTDANLAPDLGFGVAPFTSYLILDIGRDLSELGLAAGDRRAVLHTGLEWADHPGIEEGGWSLDARVRDALVQALGFAELRVNADGTWVLARDEVQVTGSGMTCQVSVLHASPEDFLLGVLDDE